jgi:hypothetical protein
MATPDLIRLGIEIVRANEPCKASYLRKALKERGANTRAANETLLILIRDKRVRRTWNGKLTLP